MNLIVVETPEKGAEVGYNIISDAMKANEIKVLGLATGSTPVKMYGLISKSDLDFSDVISINLDEYIGIGKDHPQSYHYFMNEHLFNAKPFKENHLPDGLENQSFYSPGNINSADKAYADNYEKLKKIKLSHYLKSLKKRR